MKDFYNFRLIKTGLLIIFALSLLTVGCATTPEKNIALERARAVYSQAKANPDIEANAPVAMYEATQAIEKAEKAEDISEMEHLAYISERKTIIAVAKAEQKMAENEKRLSGKEEERLLLEAREWDIKQAQMQAEAKALEVERLRKETEAKAREIERAKGEAEAMAREAEKLRKEAEAKALEIERAKSETEAKALEVEKARKEAEARALEVEKARKEAEARALEVEKARIEAEQAKAQAEQLEKEIAELKAKKTERGLVLTLGDILFETGKSVILPGAMLTIDKLSDFLKKYSNRNVMVEGHTDSVGSQEYNLFLSQRRADAVRSALISKGIAANRINTKGYGETFPIASNSSPAGRQQNRRVEIVISEEGVSGEKLLR